VTVLATAAPHHRNLVFALAAFVFILTAGGLVLLEILRLAFKSSEIEREHAGRPPLAGYFGLVSSVMAGPAPKAYRRLAMYVMGVSAVVGLVALLL
jgi:hypothetical protein